MKKIAMLLLALATLQTLPLLAKEENSFNYVCQIEKMARIEDGKVEAFNRGHASQIIIKSGGVGWIGGAVDGFLLSPCRLKLLTITVDKPTDYVLCDSEFDTSYVRVVAGEMDFYRQEGYRREMGSGKCTRLDGDATSEK